MLQAGILHLYSNMGIDKDNDKFTSKYVVILSHALECGLLTSAHRHCKLPKVRSTLVVHTSRV